SLPRQHRRGTGTRAAAGLAQASARRRNRRGHNKDSAMQITTFKDMYIAELQELMSLEDQLAEALPRLAEFASHPSLKKGLMHHFEQTQAQKQRLASMLQNHGANPRAHTDQAMQALLHETKKMITMVKGDDLRDAAVIASAQKVEHYEIAA